jgi:hypothetical protein
LRKNLKTKFYIFCKFLLVVLLITSGVYSGSTERAEAAISGVTGRGSAVSNASGTTLAVSPTANLTVGKVVFVVSVSDNNQTTDGASTFHSISDTQNHTWTKITEYTETDGAANDGVTVSVFATKVTTQITTANSITLTLGAAKTDKIIGVFEATFDTGMTFANAQTGVGQNSLTAAVSALTSREYLLIGHGGSEGTDAAKTPSTNYTELFDARSANTTADTDVAIHTQYRIATLTADSITSAAWTNTNVMQTLSAVYQVLQVPTVTTQAASSITGTGATLNGNVTNGASITVRGFAWGTSSTLNGDVATTTENGSFGTGAFTNSSLTLSCGTTYYFRPYATNTSGTGLGTIETFSTSACTAPTVTTQAASSVTASAATLNGNITAVGGSAPTVRGFAWGTSSTLNGDVATTTENGTFSTGAFTGNLSSLTEDVVYYFRAYATSAIGTGYGSIETFTPTAPIATLVQEKSAAHVYPNTTVTSTTVTLDTGATAGNLLVTGVAIDKNSGAITVPTGFTLINKTEGGIVSAALAYKIATGGETAITWNWTAGEEGSTWIGEYSGLKTSNVLDVSAENEANINTAVNSQTTGTTGTTNVAEELAIAMFAADSMNSVGTTRTWSDSFTTEAEVTDLSGSPILNIGYKLLTATGTVSATLTHDGSDESYGTIVTFKSNSASTAAPGIPTFSSVGLTSMRVSWLPQTGATSYKLERCSGVGCSDFLEIAAGVTTTYYDDTGLTPGTTYRYRVRGTTGGADGDYSSTGTQATLSSTEETPNRRMRLFGSFNLKFYRGKMIICGGGGVCGG